MKKLDKIYQEILNYLKENEDNENITIKSIQDRVGVNHHQKIVFRLGRLEKKGYLRKKSNGTYEVFDEPVKDTLNIPLYGSAQCGNKGSAIVEEYPSERITIQSSILGISNDEDYFFVKAKGNSMKPVIQDGDLMLIRKRSGGYSEGDKLFVIHNQKPKIKKVIKTENKPFLISMNKDHENLEILSTDDIEVIGIVKKVIKDF